MPSTVRHAVVGPPSKRPDAAVGRRRRRLLAIPFAVGLALVPAAALGHAELDTVTPADKSTVQGSPAEIVMTFTEALDPAKSSIRLVDAGGSVVAQGSTVDASAATTMRLALATPLVPGAYTARWTSSSAEDGDLDHGTTTFTVEAAASVAPSSSPTVTASPVSSGSPAPPATASPTASAPPTTPTSSTSDAIIPILVAVVVIAALAAWLLRGRMRSR